MALCLPVLVALLVGIVSGGTSYSRKISLDTAARDGARYGATLPVASPYSTLAGTNQWLSAVADVVEKSALNDLKTGTAGRSICVAYVYPGGTSTSTTDYTKTLVRTDSADTYSSNPCIASDGFSNATRRIQVVVQRSSTLEAVFFSSNLTLTGQGVTKFEATS